jgi:hypothetical protein
MCKVTLYLSLSLTLHALFHPPFQSTLKWAKLSTFSWNVTHMYRYVCVCVCVCVCKVILYLSLSLTFHTLFYPQFECIPKASKIGVPWNGASVQKICTILLFSDKTLYILWNVKFKTEGETLGRINWGEETCLVPCFFPLYNIFILTSYFRP